MPLFKKLKEDDPASPNVPSELPSIPDAKPAAPPSPPGAPAAAPGPAATAVTVEIKDAKKDEKIEIVRKEGLAPGELPLSSKPAAQPVHDIAYGSGPQQDRKLFFSKLVTKLRQNEKIDAIQKDLEVKSIFNTMSSQYEEEKNSRKLQMLDAEILSMVKPLEKLEEEWRMLSDEVEEKMEILKEKESEIRKKSLELKRLLAEKEIFQKKLEKKRTAKEAKRELGKA